MKNGEWVIVILHKSDIIIIPSHSQKLMSEINVRIGQSQKLMSQKSFKYFPSFAKISVAKINVAKINGFRVGAYQRVVY